MNVDYLNLLQRLAPECVVALTALVVLFADLRFWSALSIRARSGAGAGVLTAGFGLAAVLLLTASKAPADLVGGTLVLSAASQHVKVFLLLLAAATAWLCTVGDFTRHVGEFLALLALATVGMMFLVSTENLLMLFVALELVSLSLYVMTAFDKRNARSAEAALKYFLYGGMAAAFLLFGLSLLYGLTGSIHLPTMAARLAGQAGDPLAWMAIVLVLAGFGFKIAAVPFHLWAPDAYEGAPAPAAAFIASGSKVASFFALGKLLSAGLAPVGGSGAWGAFVPGWMSVVALMATASMVIGNLAAIGQTHVRRLLAYSAVAHAGYALLAVIGGSQPALLYYAITYAITSVGTFGVLAVVEQGKGDALESFAGLRERSPLLSGVMTVFILSLAGIPPLAGFFGKFYAFAVAAKQGAGLGYWWLVAVALAASCVSLFYYLQVLKQVWVMPAGERPAVTTGGAVGAVLVILAILVVLAGCVPALFLNLLH